MSAAEDDKRPSASGTQASASDEQRTMVAPSGVMPSSGAPGGAGPSEASSVPSAAAPSGFFVEETNPLFGQRYQVVSMLGAGGMGTVYLARDLELDEVVALKVLHKEAVSAPGALEMFRREVKLARKVTHPNVARTFDIGEAGGQKYLTMEYVEGSSLSRMLEESGRLPVARTVEIATAVAAGLAAAHAVGVIHRDLKPENVLVAKDGRVVITDFGVARPIESGSATVTMGLAVGTPAYMAPEQVEARRDLDHRADIYALGIMMFELLTGELPFGGDTALAVAAARLVKPPPDVRTKRPDVPAPLAEAILKCMARDRESRFADVPRLVQALATITMPALPAPAPVANAPSASKAIAVLPFRSTGDDPIFAEGLWEDLIDGLSMTEGLRVRPRSSVAKIAPGKDDPTALGKELGVDVIVEGSVRRSGEDVRVSARLVNVSDGFQLWAKRFDRKSKDLFALSDEIATAVAEALTIRRNIPERHALADPAAVELYVRARAASRKMFTTSIGSAVELFRDALALAPGDPTMLAGYAVAQVRRWFFGDPGAYEIARGAAEKALAAAPHLSEARHALALLKLHTGDHAGAVVELKELVRRGYLGGHETLAGLLNELDLPEEARVQIELALRIDPTSSFASFELARYYAYKKMWSESDLVLERLLHHEGQMTTELTAASARFLMWRGDADGMLGRLKSHATDLGPVSKEMILEVLENGGDPRFVAQRFAAAAGTGSLRRRSLLHQVEAEIAGLLSHPDWSLEAIERADAAGLIDVAWLAGCPLIEKARAHERFPDVAARVRARADALLRAYRGAP